MTSIFFVSGMIFIGALIFVITMSANPYLFVEEKYLPVEEDQETTSTYFIGNSTKSMENNGTDSRTWLEIVEIRTKIFGDWFHQIQSFVADLKTTWLWN